MLEFINLLQSLILRVSLFTIPEFRPVVNTEYPYGHVCLGVGFTDLHREPHMSFNPMFSFFNAMLI